MKSIIRPLGASMLLGCATAVWAQSSGAKIDRVDIKFVGPASVSEQFIRSNLKTKSGVTYTPTLTQDDIHTLYGTGQFYTIRVSVNQADDGGVVLTYLVQVRPRITEIKLNGNKKLSDSKLKKKITVKVGDALDEQKLFTIVQDIKELYEKYGYSDTTVKYSLNIDEITGHGVVNFDIVESLKVKIVKVEVIGAAAFKQKQLTGELKTSKHWMFSWITGSGVFKQEDFDGDRDRLTTYYRNHGYLDFEIKDVKIEHPTPKTMTVKFYVYEGRQYRVGTVKFTGNKIYSEADIKPGLKLVHDFQHSKAKLGTHNLPMDSGDIFTPSGLNKDLEAVQDFYGSKGHIEVAQGDALRVVRVPNVETGTMDVEFQIDEGQPSSVQKIEIHGNIKTKDKVIRRELAISPGETFDMVRVKISQKRLEGLDYFEKVDMQPEPTDPPIAGEKDLIINVKEKNTGNFTLGAGFSSVDSLVGFAEMTQGNFDLFHPPYFTGGGQRMRVRLQIGTQRQDYEISFVEPWFLNRKLQLGVDLYRHQLNFESPNNIYDETRTGAKVSLTKALGSDFLLGSVSYGVEDVGISLNGGWHDALSGTPGGNQSGGHGGGIGPGNISNSPYPGGAGANVPQAILDEQGDHLYQRIGASLAYDTRNSTQLPNHGQRTELLPELSVGDKNFYKLEAKTSWFFPGFFKGHVLEADGRVGVAQSLSGGDVPFYDRYYLGGLYSMRGFKFRNVAPRDPTYNTIDNPNMPNEPIGGDSFWFGSLEYSLPILEKDGGMGLRFAMFYDIGAVSASAYSFSTSYDDNWGLGIRLNIPHLGPLRLDYGIPITHDSFNGSSGKFQFGVGFERPF